MPIVIFTNYGLHTIFYKNLTYQLMKRFRICYKFEQPLNSFQQSLILELKYLLIVSPSFSDLLKLCLANVIYSQTQPSNIIHSLSVTDPK